MNKLLTTGFMLILVALMSSCSSQTTYGDPDAQRERSKQAQDEMRRDTSR
ncbi:MAG: hypothetical protein OQK69_12720 [Gammaproteobacteria bacterium]|nr:hypothetical protein [Gammaproteobacteria bacterium]